MTQGCTICGKKTALPFTCTYCGKKHCSEHMLPENHKCNGFGFNNGKPYFRSFINQENNRK